MMRVNPGATGAAAVFSWVQSMVKVSTVLPQFLSRENVYAAVNGTITAEREERKMEDEMLRAAESALVARRHATMATDHEAVGFNSYVSSTIVGPCPLRPRPMVVMISRDVPAYAADKIVESLLVNLQGVFVFLNKIPKFTLNDMKSMQAVMRAGRSCLMRVDAGLGRATRNAFLRNASVAKSTLQPMADFILVVGHPQNRHGGGRIEQCGISLEDRAAMNRAS